MKRILTLLFFTLIINSGFSQDSITYQMAKEMSRPEITIEELTAYASKNITDSNELAKFYYYWINLNITYDTALLLKVRADKLSIAAQRKLANAESVFKTKKGVCIGFSSLYQKLLLSANIKSEIITGHAKNDENPTLELETDSDFLHAWNAVWIQDKWILVDVTWANQFEDKVTDFYFDVAPEKMILNHFPTDPKWQLLDKPLSVDDFNKLPYIHSFFFQAGFSESLLLTEDEEYYYLKVVPSKIKDWGIKMYYSLDNRLFTPIRSKSIKKKRLEIYRFKKKNIPANAIIRVDLVDTIIEELRRDNYEKIAIFKL